MKKLIISSDLLKKALVYLGHAVNANTVLPILKNLYCRVTPMQIEFIATNMEITIFYRMECQSQETFDFLISFDFLSKIVALNNNCPIEIIAGKVIKINGPNDKYEIKVGEKLDQFPKLPELPKKKSFEIDNLVMHSLTVAIATCGKPEPKPKFAFVLMELTDGKVTIASTDGSYMVYSKEFALAEQKDTEDLLISQSVIKVLKGAIKARVYYHSQTIGFETDGLTIIANRTEEKYVNFRVVLPKEWPGNLKVKKSQLLEALGKCSLSSDLLHTTAINLETADTIKFTAVDQFVNINVAIPGQYNGAVTSTSINSEKLLRVLSQIDHEDIELAIHKADKQILLTAGDDPGYTGMIMPIASPK